MVLRELIERMRSSRAEAGKGVDGEVPGESMEERSMEEAGAPAMNVGEQQEAPRTGQVAEAAAAEGAGEEPPAAGHAGEEPKAAEAPAVDAGEQQEAPARGQVAEATGPEHAGEGPEARVTEETEYVGSRVGKSRGGDVMAMPAAAEPQDSDMAEGGAGEQQEEPALRVGEQQESPVMGQEAASEHLGQESEEAGAPADEDAGGEEAGAPADEAPHLFFVLKRKFFDVMVTGEKKVEYRVKKRHWERQLIGEDGEVKKFDYVEFQCAFSHPLRRFRAGFVDVSIVNEHAQQWSNGAEVAFQDTPTYAIRLGPVMGMPYLAPRKEEKAAGPATPKKRKRSAGLDSPGTGKKSRRKSGGGAAITAR